MGQDWIPNQDLTTKLLLKVLDKANEKSVSDDSTLERHRWLVFSVYTVVYYVGLMRDVEGFLLDLAGLIFYWKPDRKAYAIIRLLG